MSSVIQARQHCARQRLEKHCDEDLRKEHQRVNSLFGLINLEVCDKGIDWAEPLPA